MLGSDEFLTFSPATGGADLDFHLSHAFSSSSPPTVVGSVETAEHPLSALCVGHSPKDRESAWHFAIAERPVPNLAIPTRHRTNASSSSRRSALLLAPRSSPTSPVLTNRGRSRGSSVGLAPSVTKSRRTYRLDMRDRVVAGLWKALQELASP